MLDAKTECHPEHSHEPWLDLPTARRQLKDHILQFLTNNVGWKNLDDNEHPPVLGLKVSAGLGKTRTALDCIATHGHNYLKKGHILFYVPTLELAVEAEKTFRDLNSDHPSFVMRGRSAINPNDPNTNAPMCARSDLAKEVAKSAKSVTRAICREENANGEVVEAVCANGCPYLAQEAIIEPHVVFLAHSYLKSQPPLSGDVALRIIDEKFWGAMIDVQALPHDNWFLTPDHYDGSKLAETYRTVRKSVSDALEAETPVHRALRDKKISAETLRELAAAEEMAMPILKLDPQTPNDDAKVKVSSFDHEAANSIRVRSLIFDLLANTIDLRGTERISLEKPTPEKNNRALIKLHQLVDLPADAPMILLDADLDETIVRRFCGNAHFERLLVRPKAHVTQVSDLTLASYPLSSLKEKAQERRRADVVKIIKREVERAQTKDVLVVATTAVLQALYNDCGQEFKETSTEAQVLYGATVRRFGQKLLGVNTYSEFSTIILIGRLQLPVVTIEDQLRAVFGDSGAPLNLAEGNRLVAAATTVLRADNRRVEAKVQSHPDPRGTSILLQTREAQSEQAIARLRLLDANIPKRVIVLSNVPLPGLPVDEWLKFEAIVREKSDVQVSTKYVNLERAICGADGSRLRGIRLSAGGLVADAPKIFPNSKRAREFRKNLPTEEILGWAMTIAAEIGFPATYVRLSKGNRGGHATPAVVFSTVEKAQQLSKHLWPDFDKHVVVEGIGVTFNEGNAVLEAL